MRGFEKAQKFHEENSGMPYKPFGIKEDGPPEVVRVLKPTDDIESLAMHRKFRVLNSCRCAAQVLNEETGKMEDAINANADLCELCAAKAPRTLRTYIPVLRRQRPGEKDYEPVVQVIEYGRNGVNEIISLLDELEGGITSCDFKIKRQGKGKDTTYKWIIMPSTIRPLNEQERALADEVPNFDELFPIKPPVEMKRRAAEWLASQNAAPVSNDDEQPGDDEIPF